MATWDVADMQRMPVIRSFTSNHFVCISAEFVSAHKAIDSGPLLICTAKSKELERKQEMLLNMKPTQSEAGGGVPAPGDVTSIASFFSSVNMFVLQRLPSQAL